MFSTIFSSVLSVAHADAPAPGEQPKDQPANPNDQSDKEPEGEGEGEGEASAADTEEEEPEDVLPTLREECSNSAQCTGFKKHFEHCQEKVEAGEGFKGEDCVEELCMYMFHTVFNRAFRLFR